MIMITREINLFSRIEKWYSSIFSQLKNIKTKLRKIDNKKKTAWVDLS